MMNKKAALLAAMANIERTFGKGSVMRLDGPPEEVEVIPSGSLGVDLGLGVGGYPRGRIVEIYGPEASGKTTLTLHAIAEVQKLGGTAAIVDAEHALDPSYAARLGVQLGELVISQPDNGEQALDIVEAFVRSSAVDLVVIDSVAALVPKVELEGEMSDTQVGVQARMMSKAMRKLTAMASRSNTTVIFINQVRQKIGVTFGPSEVTTGGNALKYYASVRIDVRRVGAIKCGDEVVGNRTRVKIVKNKLAPPFRTVEFDLVFGRGVHRAAELVDIGEAQGAVTKAGSWYSFGETRLGQGREKAIEAIEASPDLALRVRGALCADRIRVVPAEA